jgi:hypothetical protein
VRQKNLAARKKDSHVMSAKQQLKGPLSCEEVARVEAGIRTLAPLLPPTMQPLLPLPPAAAAAAPAATVATDATVVAVANSAAAAAAAVASMSEMARPEAASLAAAVAAASAAAGCEIPGTLLAPAAVSALPLPDMDLGNLATLPREVTGLWQALCEEYIPHRQPEVLCRVWCQVRALS